MRVVTAVAGVLFAVGTSFGHVTITWVGGGGDDFWTNADNWDLDRVPAATDRVVVTSGTGSPIIEATDSITVETVVIGKDLLIKADATNVGSLTLTNHVCVLVPTCTYFNSVVDGTIELEMNATLAFTENHTVKGDGYIFCIERGGADIDIASGKFFRNELDHWDTITDEYGGIRGILRINGPGKIINDGNIEAVGASSGDALYDSIVVDAITEDTADGRWIVNCESILEFKQSACLEGDFEVTGTLLEVHDIDIGGTFAFDNDVLVYTLGYFIHECTFGLILGPDAEFGFAGQPGDCDVGITSASECGDTLDVTDESLGLGATCVD